MKKSFVTLAITALIAVIGFSMVSCETLSGLLGSSTETAAQPAAQQTPPAQVAPWPTNQPSIVGTWRADYGDGYFSQYVFSSNGTGRKESHAGTDSFKWTASGNTLTIQDQWGVGPMGFNIVGNTLTLGSPGGSNNVVLTRR